jgi:hypothetical protein
LALQPTISPFVSLWPISHPVHFAIDFNNQPGSRTIEVDNAATDRVLQPELKPIWTLSKSTPK